MDFQVLTVYRHLKQFIKNKNGNVLDMGCGECPYKQLFVKNFEYVGMDYFDSTAFSYNTKGIVKFDGKTIPFEDNSFDQIICTEVLEHVEQVQPMINEIHRTVKKGKEVFITIPWSARYHYIPNDYYRFTPSMLKILFKDFSQIEIIPRGTDVTTIASKLIVLIVRGLMPKNARQILFFPLNVVFIPFLLLIVPIGHLSLLFNLGSMNDPLGYTIKLVK